MLERNILTLLSHNVRQIFLAVGEAEKSLLAFARDRGQRVAQAGGADLKLLIEKRPLGTIGAAAAIRNTSQDLLVVNGHVYPAADRLPWGTSYAQRALLFRNLGVPLDATRPAPTPRAARVF